MAETLTSEQVLTALQLTSSDATAAEFSLSGTVPKSILGTEIKKTLTILGLTPEDFSKDYSTVEFNFDELKKLFNDYCKDFNNQLMDGIPSKALEFAAKMLFEYGPFIRTERKSKGDKAIRIRFPYKKENADKTTTLTIKVVIITTFKDMTFTKNTEDNKLILTFRQAGLLAMVTFSKAIEYCYTKNSGSMLLTPLCGAIFSRDSITDMSKELGIEELLCLQMINESASSGGQYLPHSDTACAIVCMITATKRIADKNVRDSMIAKVVKQYTHQSKVYLETRFPIFAKYALGGVPPGMDSGTLIEMYSAVQAQNVTLRARSKAVTESATTYDVVVPGGSKPKK